MKRRKSLIKHMFISFGYLDESPVIPSALPRTPGMMVFPEEVSFFYTIVSWYTQQIGSQTTQIQKCTVLKSYEK